MTETDRFKFEDEDYDFPFYKNPHIFQNGDGLFYLSHS